MHLTVMMLLIYVSIVMILFTNVFFIFRATFFILLDLDIFF